MADLADEVFGAVLGDNVGLVHHLELLRRVLATIDQDGLFPSLQNMRQRVEYHNDEQLTATANLLQAKQPRVQCE